MNIFLALVAAAFSLWVVLLIRIAVRFALRARLTRLDGRILLIVTLATIALAVAYAGWIGLLI